MTLIRKTLIALVALMFVGSIVAQDNPISKISISSPTAASLGKFGDIPVNYHTGVPQVSIPIYSIKSGTLSLPVSLNYHASGLKLLEPAGWVGAGWSLDAGGVITRSVMGAPDERGTNNGGTETHGHFSDYGFNSYVYNNGIEDWNAFAKGYKDGEPDLYFFNFSGYSGKFYFRDDRTPIIVPETDIKIEPVYNETGNQSIQGFTITTPDGNKYSFGNTPGYSGTTPPVEVTKPTDFINGVSSANTISAWYLNQVSSFDGNFNITLSYTPENYGYHTLSFFPIDPIPPQQTNFANTHGYDIIKNIVQGIRLSKIEFKNGQLNFVATGTARTDLSDNTPALTTDNINTSAQALGSIEVVRGTTLLKKFQFSYGYFTDNTTPLPTELQSYAPGLQTDKQRLKLNQVQEISGDGTVSVPPYIFSYFSEAVPRRMCFAIDHWGFINGTTNNQNPIPTYTLYASNYSQTFPGGDRDSHWPAMRAGTLQQITYPTGGSSTFEFEPNQSYNTVTNNVNVSLVTNLPVHMFSQNTYTNSANFTSNGSPMSMSVDNSTCNYSCGIDIRNSSNVSVFTYTIANLSSLNNLAVNLPAGSYTFIMTLGTTNTALITGGAQANLTQMQQVQSTVTVTLGGNRIKTLTNTDPVTAANIVTSYSYLADNGQSSAIVYSKPVYVSIIRNDLIRDLGFWSVGGFAPSGSINGCPMNLLDAPYFKSPSSIRPMATTQGYHVGYSQVKVSQSGNGYKLYKYYGATGVPSWLQNVGDVAVRIVNTALCDPNTPSYPNAPLPFDYLRGELQYEGIFNQSGQAIKESSYVPVFTNDSVITPAFTVVSQNNMLLGTRYSLSTAKKTQTTITETTYGQSGGALTTVSTSYNESPYHHEVTRSNGTSSKGELLESKMQYAFDFIPPACAAIASGTSQYNSSCNACLVAYNFARTACSDTATNLRQCLTDAYFAYSQCLVNARVAYVGYRISNFTQATGNKYRTVHDQAKGVADAELKPIYELQDYFQNHLIEKNNWRGGNLLQSQFTKYDYGASPTTLQYPSKYQLLNPSGLSSNFSKALVSTNTLIKDSRYADEDVYQYSSGNLTGLLPKSGIKTSYLWDYKNTSPIASVTNADKSEIAYTSFEADGTGNWTVPSTTRNTTSAATGSQSYTLSSGQISSATLAAGRAYIVSYWTTGTSSATVKANGVTVSGTLLFSTTNGWRCYQHVLPNTTTAVTVSGTITIDELRLHPKDAQMMSYTYTPLVGVTSTNSANNILNRFEYDPLQRLKLARDADGNIIKKNDYKYQQNTTQ